MLGVVVAREPLQELLGGGEGLVPAPQNVDGRGVGGQDGEGGDGHGHFEGRVEVLKGQELVGAFQEPKNLEYAFRLDYIYLQVKQR